MPIIELLQATKQRTLPYFDLTEQDLLKTYAPGKWTVKQLLHHLADAETILYDRVRRVIAERPQVIWAFDQDAWAQELEYATMPLSLNKQVYSGVRDSVIYLAEKYYESKGHKTFVHSETGVRTLKEEFDKIANHNAHHLQQIEAAIKK